MQAVLVLTNHRYYSRRKRLQVNRRLYAQAKDFEGRRRLRTALTLWQLAVAVVRINTAQLNLACRLDSK